MIETGQAEQLLIEMVRTARTFRQARRNGGPENLAGTRFGVLRCLTAGDQRPTGLADELGVSPAVASRTVDALETEGLITRRPDAEDARAVLLSITPDGRETLAATRQRILSRLAAALPDWTPEEVTAAVDSLARLNQGLAAALEVEPPVAPRPGPTA